MKPKSHNSSEELLLRKHAAQVLAAIFAVLFLLAGFEHYEDTGRIGLSAAYIVLALLGFGWLILTYLDERRERIRKEKLEEAERIAEILSAPLSKFDDDKSVAYEKTIEVLKKKYGE